jgi:hypothetical protein
MKPVPYTKALVQCSSCLAIREKSKPHTCWFRIITIVASVALVVSSSCAVYFISQV